MRTKAFPKTRGSEYHTIGAQRDRLRVSSPRYACADYGPRKTHLEGPTRFLWVLVTMNKKYEDLRLHH